MEVLQVLGGATGAAAAADDVGGLALAALVHALLHAVTPAPTLTQMAGGGAERTTRVALGLHSLALAEQRSLLQGRPTAASWSRRADEEPLHVRRWS